jgi:hypothetical protein
MSLICWAAFVHWYFANASLIAELRQGDPSSETLLAFWRALRWPCIGVAIFVFAFAWAAITSFQIMQAPRKHSAPPRIE